MMHRVIMTPPDQMFVDHIDHNGLNNTRSNLRLCTLAQNNCNSTSRRTSTSKYKGVSWKKVSKKWAASTQSMGKIYHLGYFTDEIAAARAYDKKAAELHGQFACLNFPDRKNLSSRPSDSERRDLFKYPPTSSASSTKNLCLRY